MILLNIVKPVFQYCSRKKKDPIAICYWVLFKIVFNLLGFDYKTGTGRVVGNVNILAAAS